MKYTNIPVIHGQWIDTIDYPALIAFQASGDNTSFRGMRVGTRKVGKRVVNSRPSCYKKTEIKRKELRK